MKVALPLLLATLASCAPSPTRAPAKATPVVEVAAASLEAPVPVAAPVRIDDVVFDAGWMGFGVAKCSYLAPTSGFIDDDGGIDVVWHFHAGQMSERDMKTSGVRGVFVSCGYGIGTGGYAKAFEDAGRFGAMMKSLTRTVGLRAGRKDVHLGRLALASWSAGFAAVNRILAVPEWYARTEAVVLLDSLHAQYTDPVTHEVDVNMLRRFIRFADDAVAGKKTMVITHSSILPPDYASSAEATSALLAAVDVRATEPASGEHDTSSERPRMAAMSLAVRADQGGLHVRGFRGNGPHDHFDHLHLIGEALRSWLVPHWYTTPRERPEAGSGNAR